jgi:hypothetical protein
LKRLCDNFGMALLNAEILINQQHAGHSFALRGHFDPAPSSQGCT